MNGVWSTPKLILGSQYEYTQMVVDAQGAIHLVGTGPYPNIFYMYKGTGNVWSVSQLNPGCNGYNDAARLAVNTDGVAHITWWCYSGTGSSGTMEYANRQNGRWSSVVNVSVSSDVDEGGPIALDSQGNLHVTWVTHSGYVAYTMRTHAGRWLTPTILLQTNTPSAPDASPFDLVVDSHDTLHLLYSAPLPVSWQNQVYYLRKAAGTPWSSPVKLSNNPHDTGGGHLRIGPEGELHVVWEQGGWGTVDAEVFYVTCAQDCLTPPAAAPQLLVFIPGISGSLLADRDTNQVLWPGEIGRPSNAELRKRLTLDPNDPLSQTKVVAIDAIREIAVGPKRVSFYEPLISRLTSPIDTGGGGYIEYDADIPVTAKPTGRPPAGCHTSETNATLFIFPYDWRLSNVTNAALLADYVACIRQIHPTGTIDFLTHSMGGLVARRYLLGPHDPHIGQVITIAAPWLGATKALNVLETGDFFGWDWGQSFVAYGLTKDEIKKLVQFYPGVHELAPSRSYLTVGGIPLWEPRSDALGHKLGPVVDYDTLVTFLDARFGSQPNGPRVGTANRLFHDYPATAAPNQDDWRGETTDIEYHQLYGVQSKEDTIATIAATHMKLGTICPNDTCIPSNNYMWDVVMGRGDGTVPERSASRSDGAGTSLNGPGTTTKFTSHGEIKDSDVEHGGLPSNHEVKDYVICLLRPSSCGAVPTLTAGAGAVDNTATPVKYLRVVGASVITVTDALGNRTTVPDPADTQPVPEVTYTPLGDTVHLLVLPADGTYSVTIESALGPLAMELKTGTDITPTAAVRYLDQWLPPGKQARLVIMPAEDNLHFDAGGIGTFPTFVPPTAMVRGAQASDQEAPEVSATVSGPLEARVVTLSATDAGSRVRVIRYSLDGIHLQTYSQSLSIDARQTSRLFFFADDNVGNRSEMTSIALSMQTYLPLVRH